MGDGDDEWVFPSSQADDADAIFRFLPALT